jgi:hypothetical protein
MASVIYGFNSFIIAALQACYGSHLSIQQQLSHLVLQQL